MTVDDQILQWISTDCHEARKSLNEEQQAAHAHGGETLPLKQKIHLQIELAK